MDDATTRNTGLVMAGIMYGQFNRALVEALEMPYDQFGIAKLATILQADNNKVIRQWADNQWALVTPDPTNTIQHAIFIEAFVEGVVLCIATQQRYIQDGQPRWVPGTGIVRQEEVYHGTQD